MMFNENHEILDVINCAQLWNEIRDYNVYICPTEGRSYNHKRCNYFGMYKDKTVSVVAQIEAVIDVYSQRLTKTQWINGINEENGYVERAKELGVKLRRDRLPQRIFLLTDLNKTNFIKDTKGGMFGSKTYFDVSRLSVKNSADLAKILLDKTWSEIRPANLS